MAVWITEHNTSLITEAARSDVKSDGSALDEKS
jgi:hypothetical protein